MRTEQGRNTVIEYTVRESKIIHFFDPPHLLKSLRNNLLIKNLKHVVAITWNKNESFGSHEGKVEYEKTNSKERTASWADVREFYNFTRKSSQRLIPKINLEHIKPNKNKLKVNAAAQVFSRSYGRAMRICSNKNQLPRDFTETADILTFFNDVFDSLNGGGVPKPNSLKGSIDKSSYHFDFWERAVEMIQQMKFLNRKNKKDASHVLSDFIVTIKGLSKLTTRLLEITDTVAIRRMTQDALENFFGGIRSSIYSPSVREFRGAYGSMIVNNLTCKHSIDSNCEPDNGMALLSNFQSLVSSKESDNSGGITVEFEDDTEANEFAYTDELRSMSFVENGAIDYAAGDACQKLLKGIKCDSCRNRIESNPDRIGLSYPSEAFLKCFKTLIIHGEKTFFTHCMEKRLKERFGQGELILLTIKLNMFEPDKHFVFIFFAFILVINL